MESISTLLITFVTDIINGKADWWTYAVVLFIPFSVMIAVREGYCWFNKINKVVNRLERLDRRFKALNDNLEELVLTLKQKPEPKIRTNSHFEKTSSLSEDPFIIDKDWSEKKN